MAVGGIDGVGRVMGGGLAVTGGGRIVIAVGSDVAGLVAGGGIDVVGCAVVAPKNTFLTFEESCRLYVIFRKAAVNSAAAATGAIKWSSRHGFLFGFGIARPLLCQDHQNSTYEAMISRAVLPFAVACTDVLPEPSADTAPTVHMGMSSILTASNMTSMA